MIKNVFRILTIAALLLPFTLMAQDVEMADGLRQSGKIYVVVIVIAIIVVGLFGYLYSLDKKLSKIEKSKEKE